MAEALFEEERKLMVEIEKNIDQPPATHMREVDYYCLLTCNKLTFFLISTLEPKLSTW